MLFGKQTMDGRWGGWGGGCGVREHHLPFINTKQREGMHTNTHTSDFTTLSIEQEKYGVSVPWALHIAYLFTGCMLHSHTNVYHTL